MSAKFAPGTVVRLKSGGPKMTAVSERDDHVRCMWFHGYDYSIVPQAGTHAPHAADHYPLATDFVPEALELVADEDEE